MSFFGFLTKKKFYIYLFSSIVLTAAIFFMILQLLKWYTNHGKTYVVPDFYGHTIDELKDQQYDKIFEFVVIDSLFDPGNKKEAIVMQNPIPGSHVKKDRKVYVTVVAKKPEKVQMPNLVDLTLRQAINMLHSKGLKLNRLEYVEDFAENAVLEQIYDDALIEPGTEIEKGSRINLVLGLGRNKKVPVPFLIGLTRNDAVDAINRSSFNTGGIYHLDGQHPVHSRVYKQDPDWSQGKFLHRGKNISIWLRSDKSYDFDALIESYQPDTSSVDTSIYALPEEF